MRVPHIVLALAVAIPAVSHAADKKFADDSHHTNLGFTAHTVLFDVVGHFKKYRVDVVGDPETGTTSKLRLEVDAASVDTDNERRDNHLRSEDFFDVEKFPKIVFEGNKVVRAGNTVTVTGKLTLHGVTQDVTIPFTHVEAVNGAGYKESVYKGTLKLSNKAYGIGDASVGAKISLQDETDLNLLLAGFWEDLPAAPVAAAADAPVMKLRRDMEQTMAPMRTPAAAAAAAPAAKAKGKK